MKKICYFFIFVLAVLTTFLCVEEFNSFYFTKITNSSSLIGDQLDKKDIGTIIPYSNKSKDAEGLINQIAEFAEKNDYTAVISKGNLSANDKKSFVYVYSDELDLKKDVYLEKNIDIDLKSKDENVYYTTDNEDKSATDIMYLLSDKYRDGVVYPKIYVKPLYQYKVDWKDNKDNPFVIFYSNDFEGTKQKIINEFEGVEPEAIGSVSSMPAKAKAMSTSLKLIIITILVIVLLLTCAINKSMRDISIRKMHGNSISQIISILFGRFFFKGIIVFILGLVITYSILVGEISPMAFNIIKMLLMVFGLFIGFYILLTIFIYGFIKVLSTALNMRKRHVNYTLVNINLVLKLILMVVIIAPFLTTVLDATRSARVLYDVNKYHDLDKYRYNVEGIYNTDVSGGFEGITEFMKLQKKAMETIDAAGGVYIDTAQISMDFFDEYQRTYNKAEDKENINLVDISNRIFTKSYVPFIIVNKNYLKDYEITLEDGTILNLDSISKNTMLVPECRKHVKLGKYSGYTDGEKTEVMKVKDGMSYYNPDSTSQYPSRLIENPVILVINDYNVNLSPNQSNNYFPDLELMKEKLDEAGVKGRYSCANIAKFMENDVKYNTRILIKGIVTVVLYTFIMLVFLYQSVYLYMEETKRLISVQYVLGHGKLSRYSEIIVMNLAPHAFLFMISVIFLSIPINLIFNFCATFMVIELLFMIYMIKKFEKNTVIVVLKGE